MEGLGRLARSTFVGCLFLVSPERNARCVATCRRTLIVRLVSVSCQARRRNGHAGWHCAPYYGDLLDVAPPALSALCHETPSVF